MHEITVGGITVQVVRKEIKNLHLGVYPPNGRVRVAAPLMVKDDAVRLAVIGKLAWIKRQQAQYEAQPRESEREMVSGESHYFLARRYRLQVVYGDGPARVLVPNMSTLELHVRHGATVEQRAHVLHRWYRHQLTSLVPPLFEKWQSVLGVQMAAWGIKRMKTRWGTCNVAERRIWLNLELAKKPERCLEYVILHELAHLCERHHNERFIRIMDQHLPQWRACRQELNTGLLAHETWTY